MRDLKRWEGDRAGCSTLTAPGMNLYKPLVVFVVHIYTTNMQYIVHSCYAAYATPTTTQVTHAHPTMHCICLVTRNQPRGLLYTATAVHTEDYEGWSGCLVVVAC